ncbi:MAG: hypothetical protein HGA85_02170 [Nanoarchaeota archaeon]|nr:hypothetical protein [Nanoarchaeota archaeon]
MMDKYREKILFLRLIPDEIYSGLDFSEFAIPDETVNRLRTELENTLNSYVMAYIYDKTKPHQTTKNQLCSIIRCAELSDREKDILQNLEKAAKQSGVSFAVYAKPLEFFNLH